ncbi:MAG: preprotein translocase subunit SecG [Oligoflexia bacterium]|nr:preprotein translocase subunit SecG [Oligoflexia bacterium]
MSQGVTLIAVVHIIIAIFLILVVLVQDSKGGGLSGIASGGNQSIFGATGGATLLVKITRYLAIGFMLTCVALTVMSAKSKTKSVIDSLPAAVPAQPTTPPQPSPTK